MTLPERRNRPAGNGPASDDHHGDGIGTESTVTADTERAVVGCLLLALPEDAGRVLARLADDDFTDVRCRFIVAAVRRMVAERVPVSPVTVAAYARRHNLLEPGMLRTNLASELAGMASEAPAPAALWWLAGIVAEDAARRCGADTGRRITRLFIGADVLELPAAIRLLVTEVLDLLERLTPAETKAVTA